MSSDKLEQAADLHRRWRGLGPLLFVLFYSVFFAVHLKVERSMVYLKNDMVLSAGTATFYNDMAAPADQAGAGSTGKGTAFLLLHHPVARLAIAAWTPFADSQSSARRHGVATLTAGAGALTVVFLYLALMWSNVSRLRAALLACVFGISTAGLVFSVLPQPYIFGAMGLMAALATVARGQSGSWWEFPLAALYTACCSFWHIIPLLLLALVRGARASSGGSDWQPVVQSFVSVVLLAVATLGAMKAQGTFYPQTKGLDAKELLQGMRDSLGRGSMRTGEVQWGAKVQDVFFANVAAPTLLPAAPDAAAAAATTTDAAPAPASGATVQLGPVEQVRQSEQPWFMPNMQYGIWAVWLALLLAGLLGLPMALRDEDAVLAALLVALWFVWLDGVMAPADARLLHSVLWTPAVIYLIGVGVEQHVGRWSWLRWPVGVLLVVFLALETQRNIAFMDQIAQIVAL